MHTSTRAAAEGCIPGLLVHMLLLMLVATASSGSALYRAVKAGHPTVSSRLRAGWGSGGCHAGTRPAASSFFR